MGMMMPLMLEDMLCWLERHNGIGLTGKAAWSVKTGKYKCGEYLYATGKHYCDN
jgi:hypothetical protein